MILAPLAPSPRGRVGRGPILAALRSGERRSRRAPLRNVVIGDADTDVLRLAEHLEAPAAAFAAGARRLGAAERLAQIANVLAVDEAHPRLDSGGDAVGAADVPGPDVARQAIGDVVRYRDRLGFAVEGDQARDRTEDLLLRDPHPVVDVGEDSRLDEIADAQRHRQLG